MSSTSISSIFHNMEYGPASEDLSVAKEWFSKHNYQFGVFLANMHQFDSKEPMQHSFKFGELSQICQIQKPLNINISGKEHVNNNWSLLSCHARARHLYSVARHIQKNTKLLATVGVMCGITARRMKNVVVPQMVRHFYYYAGWAQILDAELPDLKPLGLICINDQSQSAIESFPFKVGPALATGNTVCIKVECLEAHIFALLFAEICAESGLPPNVINVGNDGHFTKTICIEPKGLYYTDKNEQELKWNETKVEYVGHRTCIVYENADIDSAVEGIIDSVWNNESPVTGKGSTVLVQQPICNEVISKLKRRMSNLRVGICKDNIADLTVADSEHSQKFHECLQFTKKIGAEVYQCDAKEPAVEAPTLISGLETSSGWNLEQIPFPILVAIPFRTSKEAITICNNTFSLFDASIFTEKISLAMEAAKSIKADTVWVNCTKMIDAAASSSSHKQPGLGSIGGKEGLYEFMQPQWPLPMEIHGVDMKLFGAAYSPEISPSVDGYKFKKNEDRIPDVDTTYKLYYGGGQKRPDAGYYRIIKDANGERFADVPEANRKDVRNAVEAAVKAQPAWEKRSGFNRSQILFYLAENLDQRKHEMVAHLVQCSGVTEGEAEKEVAGSIAGLFHWAAFAAQYGGDVPETPMSGVTIRLHEAVGLIGIVCPEGAPLLAFVSLLAPAVARGNAVVIVPSGRCPTPALKFYQLLETSDVPGGIVNILTGNKDHLTKHISEHHDVKSVWYFGSSMGASFVHRACLSKENVKRMWLNSDKQPRDWFDSTKIQGYEFLYQSTRSKTVWMPMGETFAN